MRAVILAAGAGTRLTSLTESIPKALVEVCGRPLIDYVWDFATLPPFDGGAVVGGYHGELLGRHLEGRAGLRFFQNTDYRKGNILSLNAAREALEGDVLLLNVDHIFPARLLGRIAVTRLAIDAPTAIVDIDRPLFDDDMKVDLDDEGRIVHISKTIQRYQVGYIGSTYIPAAFMPRYLEALDEVLERSEGMANVEAILQHLADAGHRPHILDMSGIRWLEVDTPFDHANAERILTHVPSFLE